MLSNPSVSDLLQRQEPQIFRLSYVFTEYAQIDIRLGLDGAAMRGVKQFWRDNEAEKNNQFSLYLFEPKMAVRTSEMVKEFDRRGMVPANVYHLANFLIQHDQFKYAIVSGAPLVALEASDNECAVCLRGIDTLEFRAGHTGDSGKWPPGAMFLAVVPQPPPRPAFQFRDPWSNASLTPLRGED